MKLVVGLGNPGPEYDRTRHNVGFDVLDRLARRFFASDTPRVRFKGLLLEGQIGSEPVWLLKPTTFMNRSGEALVEAARFRKIDVRQDLLVVVDDLALPCGSLRFRDFGGTGGHNGLADIVRVLGGQQWPRLRIGIDRPGRIPQSNYVLGKFTPEQQTLIDSALDRAAEAVEYWVHEGTEAAAQKYHTPENRDANTNAN